MITTKVGGNLQQQWEAWEEKDLPIIAPTLLYYEVANALYQYVKQGMLTIEAARRAQNSALSLRLRLIGDNWLHQQALLLARQFGLLASYDAHYLALAERMAAEFWTADRRLYNTVRETFNWVKLWSPSS
jgi:predicted nucleic acid-binding protein